MPLKQKYFVGTFSKGKSHSIRQALSGSERSAEKDRKPWERRTPLFEDTEAESEQVMGRDAYGRDSEHIRCQKVMLELSSLIRVCSGFQEGKKIYEILRSL